MIPKRITGNNVTLHKPSPHSEFPELAVRAVPALDGRKPSGVAAFETAWEPTPAEVRMLVAGGTVILRVAQAMGPVTIYVEPPPSIEPEKESA